MKCQTLFSLKNNNKNNNNKNVKIFHILSVAVAIGTLDG